MASRNPLSRPFPDRDFTPRRILGHVYIGAFVFFMLYVMKPVGVRFEQDALLTSLGYGLVTVVVATLYDVVSHYVFRIRKSGPDWTLGWWVIDCGLLLACIAIGNFLFYNYTVGWTAFAWEVLALIAIPTTLIGLFPIAFSGMAVQIRAEREHQKTAAQLVVADKTTPFKPARTVRLPGGEEAVDPGKIVLAESQGNYVRVVYEPEDGETAELRLRATLKAVEEALADAEILRCHRSFLVNPAYILSATGNAQGLRLKLRGVGEEVPVSRAYVGELRDTVLN